MILGSAEPRFHESLGACAPGVVIDLPYGVCKRVKQQRGRTEAKNGDASSLKKPNKAEPTGFLKKMKAKLSGGHFRECSTRRSTLARTSLLHSDELVLILAFLENVVVEG